ILKNPTQALNSNQSHFIYGLINIAIYITAISLSLFYLLKSVLKDPRLAFIREEMGIEIPFSPSFFDFFFDTAFGIIVLLLIAFFSTFAFAKLTTNRVTFKELIALYGTLITPFVALNLLAILTGLSGSIKLTLTLLA